MNLRLEQARLEFRLRHPESLPSFASELLESGLDNLSIRILAGLRKDETEEILKYWKNLFEEQAVQFPTREESAWILVDYYLDEIVNGNISPHKGIRLIIRYVYNEMPWSTQNKKFVGDSIGLETLYGLCDSCDDLLEATSQWDKKKNNQELYEELQSEIVKEAVAYKERITR